MHIKNQPLSHTFTIFHLLILLHSLILQHIYVILVCTKNTSLIHRKPYPIARICKDCVIHWKAVNIQSSIYIHLSISRVCRKCKKALQVQGNCPLAWCFWCCNFTSGRSRFAASVPVTSRYIYIYIIIIFCSRQLLKSLRLSIKVEHQVESIWIHEVIRSNPLRCAETIREKQNSTLYLKAKLPK